MDAIDLDRAPSGRRDTNLVLRDGSDIHLRPVRTTDHQAMVALFADLSPRARAFRFFTGGADLERTARLMTDVDERSAYGVVATRPRGGDLLAHATYMSTSSVRAEVAFAVAEEVQGLGLATLMLGHLAGVARENRIGMFFADILLRNHHMIEVFEDSGFPVQTFVGAEIIRIEFQTALTPRLAECFGRGDRVSVG